MINKIEKEFDLHTETMQKTRETMVSSLCDTIDIILQTLKAGNKILLCGNGGSAADAQHFASEITGRYKKERKGLPAIALTTDSSALTAISNDYGFEAIFERQIEALANKGDLVIGISTSGTSPNIINALKKAKKLECKTIGLSGRDGGLMKDMCDSCLIIPSEDTPRIQEMHILLIHTICQMIDDNF